MDAGRRESLLSAYIDVTGVRELYNELTTAARELVKSSTDLAGFAKFWRRTQLAIGPTFPSGSRNVQKHQPVRRERFAGTSRANRERIECRARGEPAQRKGKGRVS